MNFKAEILNLHPDFNGGDISRVAEFTAIMERRRQLAIENHICESPVCDNKTYRRGAVRRLKRFCSTMCFQFARINGGKLNPVVN